MLLSVWLGQMAFVPRSDAPPSATSNPFDSDFGAVHDPDSLHLSLPDDGSTADLGSGAASEAVPVAAVAYPYAAGHGPGLGPPPPPPHHPAGRVSRPPQALANLLAAKCCGCVALYNTLKASAYTMIGVGVLLSVAAFPAGLVAGVPAIVLSAVCLHGSKRGVLWPYTAMIILNGVFAILAVMSVLAWGGGAVRECHKQLDALREDDDALNPTEDDPKEFDVDCDDFVGAAAFVIFVSTLLLVLFCCSANSLYIARGTAKAYGNRPLPADHTPDALQLGAAAAPTSASAAVNAL